MASEIARLAQLSRGQFALDVATGTGLIARALARTSDRVTGVDISPGLLTIAQSRSNGVTPLVLGDAHRLPFRDRSFDLVTCGVSLSHFAEVSVALREVYRLLRPGGRFITSAWANEGRSPSKLAAIEARRRFLADKESTFEGAFGNELWADVRRGSKVLRQAGFDIVQVRTLPLSGEYKSHSEAIEAALAWPVTRYRIAQLPEREQRRLRAETASAIRQIDDLTWRSEVHYYEAVRSAV
jgi:ubiquinone/menaquinone biosynthesis C-methylase UbiE